MGSIWAAAGPRTQRPVHGHLPGLDRCQRVHPLQAELAEGWEVEGRQGGEVNSAASPLSLPSCPSRPQNWHQGDFGDARF